jgi:hypothetical protein
VSADVSDEHIASIFRVEKISSARNQRASRWQAHGVISQKMVLFITTTVKTSNPTILYLVYIYPSSDLFQCVVIRANFIYGVPQRRYHCLLSDGEI